MNLKNLLSRVAISAFLILWSGAIFAANVAVLNVTSGSSSIVSNLTTAGHTAATVTQAEVTGGALSGYDVFIMGRNWCCDNHDDAYRDAVVNFVNAGGGLLTEWDDYAFLFDGYDSTFRYSDTLPQGGFINGDVGGGSSDSIVLDKVMDHPIWGALPDTLSVGGVDFPYTTYNYDLGDWDVVASMTGSGSANFPAQVFPAIIAGRTLPVVGMAFDWGDAANQEDIVGLYLRSVEYLLGDFETEPTARFHVTKTYENGVTDAVEVTLTCNGGLPLSQSFTIEGGDSDGVTFVVTNLPDTGAQCEVTETGGPDGYTTVMNDGAGCMWTNVTGGFRSCEILNDPLPGTFTVSVGWMMNGESTLEIPLVADVQIRCSVPFDGASYDGLYYRDYSLEGETAEAVATGVGTHRPDGANWCYAVETGDMVMGIETESDCADQQEILPGSTDAGCTISKTVFYEGIPTLNQYGLVLLILMMMGVGAIGFRRVV